VAIAVTPGAVSRKRYPPGRHDIRLIAGQTITFAVTIDVTATAKLVTAAFRKIIVQSPGIKTAD
jgi:hypothetical protein